MKYLTIFFTIWFLTSSVVFNPTVRTVFAVQVNMQANSQMYTLMVFINNGRVLSQKKNLSKDEFVKFATGKWPSIYNPQRKNMLEENTILCGLVKDSITKKDVIFCSPLDSLWKIRYSDYPFNTGKEKGWSAEMYKPSSKQAIYLKTEYGVDNLDFGYFIDTNFWKIMRDVQNPDWISNYRSMR